MGEGGPPAVFGEAERPEGLRFANWRWKREGMEKRFEREWKKKGGVRNRAYHFGNGHLSIMIALF
jgi:hypothetical protein